ncbi:MAG: MFS transporter [Herpetosiphon sp.]
MQTNHRSLRHHQDFVRLWAGQTISVFGSLIGSSALSFTAVLMLNATPIQMSLLATARLLPGFLGGLLAGVWVDRLPRRPILIATDLGRAAVLFSIPLAGLLGRLHMAQLYVVALLTGLLTVFFDVAYQSYLPALVGTAQLVEGNAKLAASASVAEVSGFGISGWLVQLVSGPIAVGLDGLSFVVSAGCCARITTREVRSAHLDGHVPDIRREVLEGLREVVRSPTLRTLALAAILINFSGTVYGTVFLIYTARELRFAPGVLGIIWGVGGLTSLIGAVVAPRLTRALGYGPAMVAGLVFLALSMFCTPLASGATLLSLVLMVVQQFGDGGAVVYDINETSLRQAIAPEWLIGRVNGSIRVCVLGATLLGALVGGVLGQVAGTRTTLVAGAAGTLVAAAVVLRSPVRQAALPVSAAETAG